MLTWLSHNFLNFDPNEVVLFAMILLFHYIQVSLIVQKPKMHRLRTCSANLKVAKIVQKWKKWGFYIKAFWVFFQVKHLINSSYDLCASFFEVTSAKTQIDHFVPCISSYSFMSHSKFPNYTSWSSNFCVIQLHTNYVVCVHQCMP